MWYQKITVTEGLLGAVLFSAGLLSVTVARSRPTSGVAVSLTLPQLAVTLREPV